MADPYIFAEITSTDRAGVVWVASILSLLYSLSTLVARFFVKYHTLGFDDWLINDKLTEGLGRRVQNVTSWVVRLQSGYLYHYAFAMLIGIAALLTWAIAAGGLI